MGKEVTFEYNDETKEATIKNRGETLKLKGVDFRTCKKIADFAEAVARQSRKDRSIEVCRLLNKLNDQIYE